MTNEEHLALHDQEIAQIRQALIATADGLLTTQRLLNVTAQAQEHTQHVLANMAESITRYIDAGDARMRSIEENLDFVARMYSVADRAQAVQQSLDRLGLSARRRQLAGQLSGGWKQRLAQLGAGLKVGISWRAGGKPAERRKRTTPIEQWAGLFAVEGIHWVSVQYGRRTYPI